MTTPKLPIDNQIYNIQLDNEQVIFKNAILDTNKLIIFCNSKSGTGKTTIATACANFLVEAGHYDGIVYIASPTQEQKQGYLKGSIDEKSDPYFSPFYDALEEIGVNINTSLCNNIMNQKKGTGYIECMTHTFQRGTNLKKKVVIIDEAQNYYIDELKKVLTRIHDSCKTIVIGHSGQIDLYKNPDRSGFINYLNWFKSSYNPHVAICTLTTNHRGWISTYADDYPGS